MFRFLETDIREQKSIKREYRHLWMNTVNDLRYEIKFENCLKDKINFFIKRNIFFKQNYISFFEMYFFKIPKNLIASELYFPRQVLKNIDMPLQKPRHFPTADANFERCPHEIFFFFSSFLKRHQTLKNYHPPLQLPHSYL